MQLRTNSLKKFASFVGVASIAVGLSFPAFAVPNTTVNNGNQLLAQDKPGSDSSPTPRTGADDRSMPSGGTMPSGEVKPGSRSAPAPATEVTPTKPSTSETVPSLPPEKTTTGNKPGPAGDTSLQPGSYWCMNNPNPQCRS
jgi:hypothetical protein